MKSALIKVLAAFIALSIGFARATEPKEATKDRGSVAEKAPDKQGKLTNQAKRMIAQDKELRAEVTAALKAKDAAKIRRLFIKRGLDLGPGIIIEVPTIHCFKIDPQHVVCDT